MTINVKRFLFQSVSSRVKSMSIQEQNFFETFRPLAIFCKLFGVFAVQNVVQTNVHLLRYSWISKDVLWGPIFYATLHYINYTYEQDRWILLLQPYKIGKSVLLCISFLVFDRFLPDLIVSIETFDERCREMQVVPKRGWLCRGKTWILISTICFGISLSGALIEKACFVPRWWGIVMSFTSVLPLYVTVLYTNLFMFFCCNLTERFQIVRLACKEEIEKIFYDERVGVKIARSIRQLDPGKWRDFSFPSPGERLERIRLLHCHLVRTCQQLNTCYGFLLAQYLLTVFMDMLSDLYQFIYLTPLATISQVIYSFYNALSLFFIVNFAGNLTEASQDIVQDLGGVTVWTLSEACRSQVQMFLSYLSANRVVISAAGFSTVNRGTLVSILINMTTYMIVIVQFATQLQTITSVALLATTVD